MPTYEYVCLKCGKEFEYSQSMKDEPLSRCIFDGCKGKVRRRVGAGAGFIFKGSGFYATDYKRNGKGHSKSKPSGEPSCPAASDSAKCASCPANASKD
ncbi:MAG: zinc ribbon domain-containing protein [Candidatus Sumerlaeota bacterium]|nr:zinc ribbon domain-containing protein [Candidatus Sumerlaeota bacterium]